MTKPEDFIMMPIPAAAYAAVCALLGAELLGNVIRNVPLSGNVSTGGAQPGTAPATGGDETPAQEKPALVGTGPSVTNGASPSNAEIDAHGHPWSADLHASTKGKTKDGLWRMKVGVSRPDPLPGFPVEGQSAGTGTSPGTDTTSATSQTATGQASAPAATSGDDEDEFAAFRAAAAASDATDQAAAASVPARSYTDADLGALCNQAAVKCGDPAPIKAIITQYVPEGHVAHSRNIPEDKRADFVKHIEEKAGIQFAG